MEKKTCNSVTTVHTSTAADSNQQPCPSMMTSWDCPQPGMMSLVAGPAAGTHQRRDGEHLHRKVGDGELTVVVVLHVVVLQVLVVLAPGGRGAHRKRGRSVTGRRETGTHHSRHGEELDRQWGHWHHALMVILQKICLQASVVLEGGHVTLPSEACWQPYFTLAVRQPRGGQGTGSKTRTTTRANSL